MEGRCIDLSIYISPPTVAEPTAIAPVVLCTFLLQKMLKITKFISSFYFNFSNVLKFRIKKSLRDAINSPVFQILLRLGNLSAKNLCFVENHVMDKIS